MAVDIKAVDLRRVFIPPGRKVPWGDNPYMMKCSNPKHQDDAESMAVYPDHVKCYGCSLEISKRMEALAYLLELPSWREALNVAEKYYRPKTEVKVQQFDTPPPAASLVGIYERLLWGDERPRMEWLLDRKLTEQSVKVFRLGHTGASFVIPVYDRRYRLQTLRYRRDDFYGTEIDEYDEEGEFVRARKKPKYKGVKGRNDTYLYPEWRVAGDYRDYLVVVEGELDCIRLWQEEVPAATVTNGAGNLEKSLLPLLPSRIKHLVLCGDRDEPGIAACEKIKREAEAKGYTVEWLQWSIELGKDVTEALDATGYTFEEFRSFFSPQIN